MLFALKGCGSHLGWSLKKSCILFDLWNRTTDIFIESALLFLPAMKVMPRLSTLICVVVSVFVDRFVMYLLSFSSFSMILFTDHLYLLFIGPCTLLLFLYLFVLLNFFLQYTISLYDWLINDCSWGDAQQSACSRAKNPAAYPPLTAMDAARVGSPFPVQIAVDAAAWKRSLLEVAVYLPD